jgi:hypothetical protein
MCMTGLLVHDQSGPDQRMGWCKVCDKGTVASVLVLAEII